MEYGLLGINLATLLAIVGLFVLMLAEHHFKVAAALQHAAHSVATQRVAVRRIAPRCNATRCSAAWATDGAGASLKRVSRVAGYQPEGPDARGGDARARAAGGALAPARRVRRAARQRAGRGRADGGWGEAYMDRYIEIDT